VLRGGGDAASNEPDQPRFDPWMSETKVVAMNRRVSSARGCLSTSSRGPTATSHVDHAGAAVDRRDEPETAGIGKRSFE